MSASTGLGVKCSTFDEDIQSPMVNVQVGQGKKPFHVHRALICNKSAFFQSACTQATPPIVDLEQVPVQLFNIFYSWLYSGRLVYIIPKGSNATVREEFLPLLCKEYHEIPEDQSPGENNQPVGHQETPVKIEPEDIEEDNPGHVDCHGQDQGRPEAPGDDSRAVADFEAKDAKTWPIDVIVKLYTLGHYLEAQLFKNEVMNVIVDHATGCVIPGLLQHHPTRPLVKFVYENTPPRSLLRNIIIDLVVYQQAWDEPIEAWKGMPEEFLIKVMVSLGRRLPPKFCHECYRKAMIGNNLTDGNVEGLCLVERLCLNKDKALFDSSACYYHEHGTEEEREECKRICRKERKAKRREVKALKQAVTATA
ncbi:hypothetical protein D6D19_00652 [Aureobasidium pullulans]|uniref:BTB domain-containing protein n=1 Tax=Aureobasidium pullulans TaxID=5580 RepID=A0A4S9AKU0_AURPU|nr:hypothetical protein D6D19_00652 [Aureobasidium pullulans]